MSTPRNTLCGVGWLLVMVMMMMMMVVHTTGHNSAHCIFDEVQNGQRVDNAPLNYKAADTTKTKRSIEDQYQPIRLKSIVQDEPHVMDDVQVDRLRTIMGAASSILHKVLSVYPVSGPLIMQRSQTACRTEHTTGPNKGKCSAIAPLYREECLDNFLIPDDHLGHLWTWDAADPEPSVMHYPVGSGIPNTDTVLYVRAEHTNRCNTGGVFAYAAYCKLDQFNRPIAGGINFCPDPLMNEDYNEEKFVLLALHETLHVLGFSSSLFDKFQECSMCGGGLECHTREGVLTVDSSGQPSLHSPAVLSAAQAHFQCDDESIGAPLESLAGDGFSSHWEMRYMYGSIMAAVIQQPSSTFLDNLTLAVFEDSGWYRVNYMYADDFLWGKGQGCAFGLPHLCETNFTQFFCKDSTSGCDYVNQNKATCSTNAYLEGCRIYWPHPQSECSLPSPYGPDNNSYNVTGEASGPNSHCFLSNAVMKDTNAPGAKEGRCYLTRCDEASGSYEVQLVNSEWLACSSGSDIGVPGYDGKIYCPPPDVICRSRSTLLSLVDHPCPTCAAVTDPLVSRTRDPSLSDRVSLSLTFTDLDYSLVDEESEATAFIEAVRKGIADLAQIQKARIEVSEVLRGSVLVLMFISEGASDSEVSAQQAYNIISSAVLASNLFIEYNQINYTVSLISLINVSTPSALASSVPSVTPAASAAVISPLSVLMLSLLAGLFAATLLGVCLWKQKKAALTVAPAPVRAPTPTPAFDPAARARREVARPGNAYVLKNGDYSRHWEGASSKEDGAQ